MTAPVDLHIHSEKSSDGDLPSFIIIQLAKEYGLRAISIADHDTVDAYPDAILQGNEVGVEIIPNIEVTTLFDNREFHLLLPFVDWKSPALSELVDEVAARRVQEAQERVEKLRNLGFEITWEEISRAAGPHPPLGVTIAQYLLRKSEMSGDPSLKKYSKKRNKDFAPYLFYRDYFMEGKPAFVSRRNISIFKVLEAVPKTGAVPVLAHPGAYFQQVKKEDVIRLKEKGLGGIEVYTSYHDRSQTDLYNKIAEDLQLVPTAGSDFHGAIKPHIPFGFLNNGGYWIVEELKKRRP